MFQFTTEVDIDIIGGHDADSGLGRAKIKWTLELEMRERGIKAFLINVPDQTITLNVTRYDEEDEEYTETVTLELKDVKTDTSFGHSSKDIKYLDLIPTELEVWGGKFELKF